MECSSFDIFIKKRIAELKRTDPGKPRSIYLKIAKDEWKNKGAVESNKFDAQMKKLNQIMKDINIQKKSSMDEESQPILSDSEEHFNEIYTTLFELQKYNNRLNSEIAKLKCANKKLQKEMSDIVYRMEKKNNRDRRNYDNSGEYTDSTD